jgi:16S rRNA (cytidine1402-2'-O)-methyltransferase
VSNEPGVLYVVATPIGNLDDITQRALKVLESVDVILAEDTRRSKQLLSRFGLHTPLLAFHEHNEARMTPRIVERLAAGENAALVSDAGTPLISDPGYPVVRALRDVGIPVVPVPGASALLCALSAAGLPVNRFVFEGFLPPRRASRMRALRGLAHEQRTLVFYESPRRICAMLRDLAAVLGEGRGAVVARELTKVFETFRRDTLGALADWIDAHAEQQRGEFVVVVEGAESTGQSAPAPDDERLLRLLLEEVPARQAVSISAKLTGKSRNALYKLALDLSQKNNPR